MAVLEKKSSSEIELKPYLCWRYIDGIFLLWEYEEEKLKEFIEQLNEKNATIKFNAEWSQTLTNFLDITVSNKDGKVTTDSYVKPRDSHQYLHSSSCYPCHCKKQIPYIEALNLNRICSDPNSFDRRCSDIEKWLIEKSQSEQEARKQILSATGFWRRLKVFQGESFPVKLQVLCLLLLWKLASSWMFLKYFAYFIIYFVNGCFWGTTLSFCFNILSTLSF